MSELQIAVAVVGVLLIMLVVGYNVFQEWRYRRKTRNVFSQDQKTDVLVDSPLPEVRDGRPDRLEPIILAAEPPLKTVAPITAPTAEEVPPPFKLTPSVELGEPPETMTPVRERAAELVFSAEDAPSLAETDARQPVKEAETPASRIEPNLTAASATVDEITTESTPLQASAAAPITATPDEDDMIEVHTPPVAEIDMLSDQQAIVRAMLDPNLDFIAEVRFSEMTDLPTLPRFIAPKRVQILACTAAGRWQVYEPNSDVRYRALDVGLQMVDRNGVLDDRELEAFCEQIRSFATQFGAAVQFPQPSQQLAAARDLDRFCAEIDVMIGLNVFLRAPVSASQIIEFIERFGLELHPDGRYHCVSDSGNSLYSLGAFDEEPLEGENVEALTLLFDVPRVAGGTEVFERAVQFARELARTFNGHLVDDNQRTLSETGIDTICRQLDQIYTRMDDRGVAPGSVAALRLFA